MKTVFLLLILIGTSFLPACKKEKEAVNNSGILSGTYKLTGVCYDSIGGTGTFQPVTSEKTITFHMDGTITSNGNLCFADTDTTTPTSGTYSNGNLTVTNCGEMQYKLSGLTVIIGHGCFEQCKSRFERI